MQLFGHPRQGASHDIPARVDEFVKRTEGILGSAEVVIREHTLVPFYLPLRREIDAEQAISAIRAGGLGGIKARLGILASGFGAANPLKACMVCVKVDGLDRGVSSWHLDHQWPGAWICLLHDAVLQYGLGKVNAEGRFHWYLPQDIAFAEASKTPIDGSAMQVLRKLTACACGLGRLPQGFHFDQTTLAQTYQSRMIDLGLASPSGRLRSARFAEALASICEPLSRLHGMEILAGVASGDTGAFSRLMQERRSTPHPLKHLIFVTLLFESWQAFTSSYQQELGNAPFVKDETNTGKATVLEDQDHSRSQSVAEDVRQGMSVTRAAEAAGVSVATAIVWSAAAGVPLSRRPKKLTPRVRAQAVASLKRGHDKGVVASLVGVSIQTITFLLRSEPGLRSAWNAARLARARKAARTAWTRAARRFHSPMQQVLRQREPAAFAWLYRNDRQWLQQFTVETLLKPRPTNNAHIDWNERDRVLSASIEIEARNLVQTKGRRLKLSDLCNAVPQLKALFSKIRKLPLTRAAVASALSHRS
ncbi:hypothetical protein GCM10027034_37430 [Ramlibacter solisilvae]|uniref:Transposon Tn7 transposition protein TnsD C-terminal domain-containing protein n=2 Tax=Ramlibacter tataouinensis TaxID=94132 RepID=A0A127JUJ7_9BURK|nr:hypothetical protein UC35_13295 [Ramlibacter tataouinensis]